MARPRKQEVDYFPHYCDHGKVLFILENNFQNDGYAVFYKLQELLAKTEGHCYDCSRPENWEYLISRMNVPEETVVAIIDKLVAMNVIDGPLWAEHRIWMQSFVDSISDVYGRRKADLPIKPELLHTETPLKGITDDINPQSKVKESKVKESKEKKSKEKKSTPPDKKTHLDAVLLTDEEYTKLIEKYGRSPTDIAIEILNNAIMSKGYKYKSHYHTIIGWPMREAQGNGNRSGIGTGKPKAPGAAGRAESDGQPYPSEREY